MLNGKKVVGVLGAVGGIAAVIGLYPMFSDLFSPKVDTLTVDFDSPPATLQVLQNWDFKAIVRGGKGPYTYIWSFDDGSPPVMETKGKVSYKFGKADEYTVSVTVKDSQPKESPPARTAVKVNRIDIGKLSIDGTSKLKSTARGPLVRFFEEPITITISSTTAATGKVTLKFQNQEKEFSNFPENGISNDRPGHWTYIWDHPEFSGGFVVLTAHFEQNDQYNAKDSSPIKCFEKYLEIEAGHPRFNNPRCSHLE